MDDLKSRSDDFSIKQYVIERDKLNEILLHEKLYWKKRAKLFWLKEGDENTKFFHAHASARKKNNRVDFLITDEGTKVDSDEVMCAIVHEYFTGIFIANSDIQQSSAGVSPRVISNDQNQELVEEVTYEEFTVAVHQMNPDKANGPDGLNPSFY